MLDDHGFEIYDDNVFPIAYLLTFRTFGTWLHGDQRDSIQRTFRDARRVTMRLEPNVPLEEKMRSEMKREPVTLNISQREIVDRAIREVCSHRDYLLRALNVRTNHAHVVVSKAVRPERIVSDFKAYATRRLREELEFADGLKIWSRGASTRYLWKPRHVLAAVDYVLYSQGDVVFEML